MAFGSPPIPNSADRRAWLRSYHYYRSKLMEEPVGLEALDRCRQLIEADGGWTPPKIAGAAPASTAANDSGPARKPKPGEEKAKNHPPEALAGTAAAIHHQMPFFKEGRVFADPWRLPEKAKSILRHFAKEALASEDSDLMIPEPDIWRKWVPSVDERGYGIASLRAFDVLRGLRMAGILSELERRDDPVIWQIGPSAAISRALKTRLPRARLIISCAPWEMVSPLAFLQTALPDIGIAVTADAASAGDHLDGNEIVFVPATAVGELALPRLDVVIDAMSLQLGSAAASAEVARRAYELGAMYAFALTLDGESPEWPMSPVAPSFEPYFWLHQMPVWPVVDWQMATLIDEGFIARGFIGRPEDIKYWKMNAHFTMGWRRMKT